MPGETALNKKPLRMKIPLLLAKKIEVAFGKGSDEAECAPYLRALDEVTKRVMLTKADYDAVEKEIVANKNKRLERRRKSLTSGVADSAERPAPPGAMPKPDSHGGKDKDQSTATRKRKENVSKGSRTETKGNKKT